MEIMHGGKRTSLTVIRLCEMDITSNIALEMCESLHMRG